MQKKWVNPETYAFPIPPHSIRKMMCSVSSKSHFRLFTKFDRVKGCIASTVIVLFSLSVVAQPVTAPITSTTKAEGANLQQNTNFSLTFTNKCDATMYIALRYWIPSINKWATEGWWRADPNKSVTPSIATSNSEVYYTANDARSRIWPNSKLEKLKLRVIHEKFGFFDVDSSTIGYEAAFGLFPISHPGENTLNLTCNLNGLGSSQESD